MKMRERKILITAPSLDTRLNVSGISSVTNFIISNNKNCRYQHFELGRRDDEKRNILWLLGMIKTAGKWMVTVPSKKIELVHFNFALSRASILRDVPLVLFAKFVGKKMLIHIHGGDYLSNKAAPRWMQGFLKKAFSGNTAVIVLSADEKTMIAERYMAKNITILPNCVDVKEAQAFKRNHTGNAVVKLLFIGRISKAKGLDFIYDALSELKTKQVPFKFFMAGTGADEKEYVKKFAELLGDSFDFKGVVSGTIKTELYKNCDVFLLPSLFEGLPMSLLEAMSFGLVPVVTDVGAMSDAVINGKTGIIIEMNDHTATEMVKAIDQLVNNTDLVQQLGVNAANFIFTNYSPVKYVEQLNKIYTEA